MPGYEDDIVSPYQGEPGDEATQRVGVSMDLHPRVQQILALKWKGPLSQKEWAQSLPKCVRPKLSLPKCVGPKLSLPKCVGPKLRMYSPKYVPSL